MFLLTYHSLSFNGPFFREHYDIYSCFDKISHNWLLENIPMDRIVLKKFLKAGFMEKAKLYPAELGTIQGGTISPTLALMTLAGLENKIRSTQKRVKDKEKINIISYADDFIITASSAGLIQDKVIPIVTKFLGERGLELSREKSKITSINEGFDYLGFNIRKYQGKLLIKPAKGNIKGFLKDLRKTIKTNKTAKTETLISLLNPKIAGWVNYYRSAVSSRAFSYVDDQIFRSLQSWAYRRHPNKVKSWVRKRYYTRIGLRNWIFYTIVVDKKGNKKPIYLRRASDSKIRRHIKIKSEANPYNPIFNDYFKRRESMSKTRNATESVATETKLLSQNLLGGSIPALPRA